MAVIVIFVSLINTVLIKALCKIRCSDSLLDSKRTTTAAAVRVVVVFAIVLLLQREVQLLV